MKNTNPIGIFDSGIGGLTVGHQITKLMPNERIVYFGDTQHLPYGDKSAEAIKTYSKNITTFLLEHKCKMIVIACNTASALAFKEVQECCKDIAIPINVIDPVVSFSSNFTRKTVGIIGTKNTIASDVYALKIKTKNPLVKVSSLATPLLVPMIEEGFYKHKISATIIANYLENEALNNIDHLILGCTHYPLIEEEILNYFGVKVQIINSAKIVSQFVKKTLIEYNISANSKNKIAHQFFVSDYTDSFEQSAHYFFGEKISLVEVKL